MPPPVVKKARQRISYVLDSAKASAGGHRLGVNGLALDDANGVLYSGGRDGIVCAWDLNLDSKKRTADTADTTSPGEPEPTTVFRAQTQAHMNWINDIALAQHNNALISASSDLSVKVWRPHAEEPNTRAQTIGEHADYVKCIATPPAEMNANWIASGSLDRKICLWDLNGGGKTLEIDVKGDEVTEKGSVYALSLGRNILASGGPEKTVRLYDPRTGTKISKLVGHIDNIRSILIDETGDTILSASADKTIKMWSVKGGRCMYTFTMHDESIWSLYSDDPTLGVFYSADRSGLVAKTDVRGSLEDFDDGLSLAIVHEHSGLNKVVAGKGYVWTATNQSSINRWLDVDTSADVLLPESLRVSRTAELAASKPPQLSIPTSSETKKKEVLLESILRISNTAVFPARITTHLESNADGDDATKTAPAPVVENHELDVRPLHFLPDETIEGQFGLLKHKLLNDRRRVLTLDTAGDVLLWDLIKCKPVQSFGKQLLEDVEVVVNTREAVAPWCSIDVSSGYLTVVLEPFNCFDAEVYADELELDDPVEFRDDQRISLGRWVLRYLFANLIDEEIKRDEAYRHKLNLEVEKRRAATRANGPGSITIPQNNMDASADPQTPRANGTHLSPTTPGISIGMATPGVGPTSTLANVPEGAATTSPSENKAAGQSAETQDYFTAGIAPAETAAKPAAATSTTATESSDQKTDAKGKEKAADSGKSPAGLGKKFRMSFGSKKLGRSSSQATQDKPAVSDDKGGESESSSTHDKEVEDNFYGIVQKIRHDYDKQLADAPDRLVATGVKPSLAHETPVLKLPPTTKIIIQEETSGGSINLYQGTVETVGKDADIIEQKAPMWLGDVLLQNQVPVKDPVKVSFVLHPLDDLPAISITDGNNRLNANRMLRVKKILAYVAERVEPPLEEADPNALKPEEYLELYCNDQPLDPTMSLATLRTHVWKGGNDIVLHYKSNGRREMRPFVVPAPPEAPAETQEAAQPPEAPAAETSGASVPAS